MKKPNTTPRIKRIPALLLCLMLAALLLPPAAARAQDGRKVVRVGWNESPFNTTDQFGRRSGYAYVYQRKLAAYTGWSYEYVEGSWAELYDKLAAGEIDLLSDVSYTPERAKDMLFASLPMGTETYHVFVAPGNNEITSDNAASLNGKKIGVMKSSIQKGLFLEWAEKNSVQAELTELTVSEDEALRMLGSGGLDAYVTMDIYAHPQIAAPVFKIGASDFFFAVSKSRPDLQIELDAAMNRIQDENKYYNEQLYEKYLQNSDANLFLSVGEKGWLINHGTIRVGYQDNYLAFCASDETTGALTGALKDFLDYASTALENTTLVFQPVAFPTAAAAMDALIKGEVDCMFPANLTDYDGETLGVVMTPTLMHTEMDAVVRLADQKEFIRKEQVAVAVDEGNTNYDMFLIDRFPGWKPVYFKDTPAGLDAVAEGKADCMIISNYRFNNISKQCEILHLTTVYTGVDMDYFFAVREGDTELYSIVARLIDVVPSSIVNAALTYYSTEDVKTSFSMLLRDNLGLVMTGVAVVLLLILILLVHSIKAEKKAAAGESLVSDLNKRVFVDALTSVRNKAAFSEYVDEMQQRVDKNELKEFAIGVFDCDKLKSINDHFGHDKGDHYLKNASRLICRVFQHSPVFRIGGDEFAVVLQGSELKNKDQLVQAFVKAREELNAAAMSKWDEAHISLGIAVYDPQIDGSVSDAVRRADRIMYENKRDGKKTGE